MKPRDVVISTLEGERLEHPPATTFGSGIWTLKFNNLDFRSIIGKPDRYSNIVLKTQKITGWDLVFLGSGMNNFVAQACGSEVKVGSTVTVVNRVEELQEFSPNSGIETVWKASRLLYDKSDFALAVTSWGPFTLASNIVGMERFLLMLMESKKEAEQVVKHALNAIMEFYTPIIEAQAMDIASIAEPSSSGDVISPEHFRKFSKPYLEQLVNFFRKRGVKVLLHICGKNDDRLEEVAEIKADCFSPGETTDFMAAKQIVGRNSALLGNVAPVDLLEKERAVKLARENMEVGFSDSRGYILSTGCDLNPETPLENVRAFLSVATQ